MARSPDAVLAELLSLPAEGWALPRTAGTHWARLLTPLAAELARVEGQAEALLPEVDPRKASALLEDFERVLGNDPCLGAVATLPIEIRRGLAHQRWTAQGGVTPAYFLALATGVRVAITIEEAVPSYVGAFECGGELCPEDELFVWVVKIPAADLDGNPISSPSPVECLIRRHAPAHTTVVFEYLGA